MQRFISYIISPIFMLLFYIVLCIFHVVQVIAFRVFGYQAHKNSVDALNYVLLNMLHLLGSKTSVRYAEELVEGRAYIIVANHQSLYDIVGIYRYLRPCHAKFVSKIELGKGIPSISYNLKHGGSVLIDRKDNKQAISALINFGKRLEKEQRSACIFPEGTRSRDGKLKQFSVGGLSTLMKYMPSAVILPVAIKGTGDLHCYGNFPIGLGKELSWDILPAFDPKGMTPEEAVKKAEEMIRVSLGQ